jgi:hypothetical protein
MNQQRRPAAARPKRRGEAAFRLINVKETRGFTIYGIRRWRRRPVETCFSDLSNVSRSDTSRRNGGIIK